MEEKENLPNTGLSQEDLPIDEDGNLSIPRDKEKFKRMYAKDQAEMAWRVFAYCLLLEQGIEGTIRDYLRRIEPEKMKELEKEERENQMLNLLTRFVEEQT